MSRKSSRPIINHRAPTKVQRQAMERLRVFAAERMAAKQPRETMDPAYRVERVEGIVSIPLEDAPHLKARIREADYERLTLREGHNLTRARWYLDDGMVRAMSRSEKPKMTEGILVAALLCGAQDGDMLKIEDPLTLFPETIKRFVAA